MGTKTATDIRTYYRNHDDFTRYSMTNEERVRAISRLYSLQRKFFGKRVLDLACGAGIMGFVVEPKGHAYLGVDNNRDMIRSANSYAKKTGSHSQFVLGDAKSTKMPGKFDTVTLVGNAVIHFNTSDYVQILKNVERNVHIGTYFIVDYRDVVSMLYTAEFGKKPYTEQNRHGKTIVSLGTGIDTVSGEIKILSSINGQKNIEFTHAIWAPFIVQPIMEGFGWQFIDRKKLNPNANQWIDAYRKIKT